LETDSVTGSTLVRADAELAAPARAAVDREVPILEVEDLHTYFHTDAGVVRAVDGVSFSVRPGETLGIVGESGSGKSVTASSIMRLVAPPGRIEQGRILFRGQDIVALPADKVRDLRGGSMAMIFQDPMTSLNPVLRISRQLEEAMLVHRRYTAKGAAARAVELLGRMGITAPERAVRNYPHQFSGGMRQRVMLAMGFANDPALLIADEPTTALDVTVQAQILDLLRQLNDEFGVAIILISHDLGVVGNLCSRVVVMYGGQVVEEGPTERILREPKHPYTWALLNAAPRLDQVQRERLVAIPGTPPDLLTPPIGCRFAARCPFRVERCDEAPELLQVGPGRSARCWVTQAGTELPLDIDAAHRALISAEPEPLPVGSLAPDAPGAPPRAHVVEGAERPIVSVPESDSIVVLENLVKHFPVSSGGLLNRSKAAVRAVDGVDLSVRRGETVGLVGESGSGKSTLARLIVRLHEPTAGRLTFDGIDITHASTARLRPLRSRLQMIFQDPYSSLNPRMTVGATLVEPLRSHRLVADDAAARARVAELLDLVGLEVRAAKKYPYEFSGGQRQRIGIARALAVEPEVLVADEPVSSLDVNIQAQVINLLEDLQGRLGLTYVFIAHDLSVVRHVSDRIAVMYLGKIVEVGPATALVERPIHPYTRALISAAPVPDPEAERRRTPVRLTGEIPSPISPPSGCRFRTRCPIAQPVCAEVEPPMIEHEPTRWAACHFPHAAGRPEPVTQPRSTQQEGALAR
jgi:peptide/nickel transport system ATP-binding protein